MRVTRSLSMFVAVLFLGISAAAAASAADPGKLLPGTWKMVTPAKDADGNDCPFVPEVMEFFTDGTMSTSNMPGRRLPYKTDLTAEETQAMEARDPALKGRNLLLAKPVPQMDWRSTPMVYSYSVTKNELRITVTGWTTATFQRVK